MRNAIAGLHGIRTAVTDVVMLLGRSTTFKQMIRTFGALRRASSDLLFSRCLLTVIGLGLIATSAMAASASASEPTPLTDSAGESRNSAISNSTLPIASIAEAERLLKDVDAQRESINARYKGEEAHCSTKFFVTSCIDDAKERRRIGLRSVQSIEVQANAFKRAYKAEQRDMQLQRKQPVTLPRPELPRSEDTRMQPDNASMPFELLFDQSIAFTG